MRIFARGIATSSEQTTATQKLLDLILMRRIGLVITIGALSLHLLDFIALFTLSIAKLLRVGFAFYRTSATKVFSQYADINGFCIISSHRSVDWEEQLMLGTLLKKSVNNAPVSNASSNSNSSLG